MVTIKFGEASDIVRKIQEALLAAGYQVTVDSVYGQETRSALDRFKADKGLSTDEEVIRSLFPTKQKVNLLPYIFDYLTKGEKMFTKEWVMQAVRDVVKIVGGMGVFAGLASQDVWVTIGAGAAALVGVIWSAVVRKDANASQ